MPESTFTDRRFDLTGSAGYVLGIQIDKSGLSYIVAESETGLCVAFKHHPFEQVVIVSDLVAASDRCFSSDEYLRASYSRIMCMPLAPENTIIPHELFSQNDSHTYLSFVHGESESSVFVNPVPVLKAWNVFGLPASLVSAVLAWQPATEFWHQMTPFLMNAMATEDPVLHADIHNGFVDIAFAEGGKLKLHNTFEYSQETDLLYYFLLVAHQVSVDPAATTLFVSGEMSNRLSYLELLRQYFLKVSQATIQVSDLLAPALFSMSPHKYLNLINLVRCESLEEPIKAGE